MRKIDRLREERREAVRPPRRRIPALNRLGCTSYAPGHKVHWVQATRTASNYAVSAASWRGRLTSIDGELLTVEADGHGIVKFRNHDPERLAAVAPLPSDVLVNDQFAILRVGTFCFSVGRDGGHALGTCPTAELPADATDAQLADRVNTHGGFSVPVHRRRTGHQS
jgi:hypothetical protein